MANEATQEIPVAEDVTDWITLHAASVLLGVSRLSAMHMAMNGDVTGRHIAGRTVFSRSSIERYLAKLPAKSA